MNIRNLLLRQIRRLAKAAQIAKDAKDFAQALNARVVDLETKAEAAKTKLQDHEQRITALENP